MSDKDTGLEDRGHGHIYVNENCYRAITHLYSGSGPERRKRIFSAVFDAHRPNDNEFFNYFMSPRTLTAWRACKPKGNLNDLTDEQVLELAQELAEYLFNCQRDLAKLESD